MAIVGGPSIVSEIALVSQPLSRRNIENICKFNFMIWPPFHSPNKDELNQIMIPPFVAIRDTLVDMKLNEICMIADSGLEYVLCDLFEWPVFKYDTIFRYYFIDWAKIFMN